MKLMYAGLILFAASATLFTGCAAGGGESNPFSADQTQREIKIIIKNQAFMDATVYAVSTGGMRRLGQVTGKRETVFTMSWPGPSDLYLEIDILAGPRCRTERMLVDPGDEVELIIETDNPRWVCNGR